MIINKDNKIDFQESGEALKTTYMKIDVEDQQILMELVVGFYKEIIPSIVREWASNAEDSHRAIKNPAPIIVSLIKNNDNYKFTVQDFGEGIDQKTIDTIMSKMGLSTKSSSADLIGSYGIGLKSGWAYSNYFTVIGRKDGKEGKWLFNKDDKGFSINTIYENKVTSEKNGAIFELPVKHLDVHVFSTSIKQQLAYFKNVYIVDQFGQGYNTNEYKIIEGKHYKISELYDFKKIHLTIDDVYYAIDWDHLGISPIYFNLALKFSLTDGIIPLPARESYRCTDLSKQLILNKLTEVANELISEYNDNIKDVEYTTWQEGSKHIKNNNFNIIKNGETFYIDKLLEYGTIPLKAVKIKGYDSNFLIKLKKRESYLLTIFKDCYRFNNYDRLKSANIYHSFFDKKYIIYDKKPSGYLLKYLKENYHNHYLVKVKLDNKLKTIHYHNSWYYFLDLSNTNKKDWRNLIIQAQQIRKELIKTNAINLSDIVIDEQWLKEEKKQNRKKREHNGNILNKQKGDVTIAYYNNSAFKKAAYKISDLNKINKGITIYSSDIENKYRLSILNKFFKTAIIGKREQLKIKNNPHFYTMEQFKETKYFRKFISGLRAAEVYEEFREIIEYTDIHPIIESVYKEFSSLKMKLRNYYSYDIITFAKTELGKELIQFGISNNMLDHSIEEDIKKAAKIIEEVRFCLYLKKPVIPYYTHKDEKEKIMNEFKNVFYKILLFNKLHKDKYKDWSLCQPENKVEEIDSPIVDYSVC